MSILRTEAYYHATDGKNKIRTLIWKDSERAPIAVLQIAHGLAEHIGRYDRFSRFMTENGFVVCGNDHLGHGKTAPSMEKLGDFGSEDADIRMVDDMHVLHNIMSKRYPELPYFIFGHDMGSFLTRIYASEFGSDLKGIILSATTQLSNPYEYTKTILDTLGAVVNNEKYSDKAVDLLGKITARYYREDDEDAWMSLSLENREEALADPYFGFPITNGSAMTVTKLALKSSSDECFDKMPKALPVMIVSGGQDSIGLFGRGVVNFSDKLTKRGIINDMILYPGLRHEILNEDDFQHIYDDILNWTYDNLKEKNIDEESFN